MGALGLGASVRDERGTHQFAPETCPFLCIRMPDTLSRKS